MKSIVHSVVEEMGGCSAFAKLMGHSMDATDIRELLGGSRVPSAKVRLRMVAVSGERFTEGDVIALSGSTIADVSKRYDVHPMWSAEDDDRRAAIYEHSRTEARRQRHRNLARIE